MPRFNGPNAHLPNAAANPPRGFHHEDNHPDHRDAYNLHCSATNAADVNLEPHYLTVWSSYRYRQNESLNVEGDIRVFFTMVGLYGTNVTVGRSDNPALIMPDRP